MVPRSIAVSATVLSLFAISNGSSHGASLQSNQGPCAPPPAGLAAWWTANSSTAGESFGRQTDGDVLFVPGKVGQAFHFVAESSPLAVSRGEDFNLASFSVEAWVRRSNLTVTTLNKGAYPGGNICGYNDSWNLVIADDGKVTILDRTLFAAASSTAITDSNWHHIAVIKDGQNVQFYIDAAAVGSATYSEFPLGTAFAISGLQNGLGSFNTLLGDIDELSIYTRAITLQEIASIYNSDSIGKCSTDVSLLLNPALARVQAGTPVPITLQLSSRGQPSADNVVISLTGPQGVTFSGLAPSIGTAGVTAGTVTWNAGAMPDGASGKLNLLATLSASGVHYLNATVATDTLDIRLTNNLATTRIEIFDTSCVNAPEGLLVFYNAETFEDFLGSGPLENLSGMNLVPGWKGNSFAFTGGFIQGLRSPAAIPPLSNFTVQLWVQRAEGGGLLFNANRANLQAGLTASGEMYFVGDNIYISTRAIADDKWHHLAWTKNDGTLSFYMDGASAGVFQADPSMQLVSPFALGALGDLSGPGFVAINGLVDEFALFDRALTVQEIGRTFLSGAFGICAEDISIAAQVSLAAVPLGETNLLRLSIANRGVLPAHGVTLTNLFPTDNEILSVTGATTLTSEPGLFRGSVGDIPPGSAQEIVFAIRARTAGQKQMDVSVAREDHDMALDNNMIRATFSVFPLTASAGPDISITESDTNSVTGSFSLNLNLPSEIEQTVYLHWNDVTASSGVDYEPGANKAVFPPGATNIQVFVTVIGDLLYEGDEFFKIELDATNSMAIGSKTATARIVENDRPPIIRVNHIAVDEGNSGTTIARFEIRVEGTFAGQLSVPFFTTNITATSGTDYESVNGTLVFTQGARAKTIDISISGDSAVESNETFALVLQGPAGPLLAQCVIIDDDSPSLSAPVFAWDEIPNGVSLSEPMIGRMRALRPHATIDASFGGSGQLAVVRGIAQSPILFTEIDVSTRDTVELQNVSSNVVDLSGWKVYFYDASWWPAPTAVLTFTNGTILASKATTVLTEGATPRVNGYAIGAQLAWGDSAASVLTAVLLDDAFGNTRDFVALNVSDTSEIMDPHPVEQSAWNSVIQTTALQIGGTFQRIGNQNHRSPQDWSVRGSSIGTGLPAVFTDAELLPISPATASFNVGTWSGNISGLPATAPLALAATDQLGRIWYSNPFTPTLQNDVSVSLSHPDIFVYSGMGTFISLIVTNPGPDFATNVIADLFVPASFAPNTPTVSQGTVTRASLGSEVRVRGTLGNIAPASNATVNLNIPLLPSRFDTFTTDPVTFYIHGNTTNLVGDPNLSNNSATTTNEISKAAAIPQANLISWWPAELNGLDVTGKNPLHVSEPVQYVPSRVGFGFKLSGESAPLVANDDPSLDFGPNDDFWIEFWLQIDRIPADGIIDIVRKLEDPAQTGIGWRLFVDHGVLRLYYRDSLTAEPLFASVNMPRSEQWHYITLTSGNSAGMRTVTLSVASQVQNFGQFRAPAGDLSNSAPLVIGDSLAGIIDELAIFKGPIAAPRANIFAAGAQGKTPAGLDSNGNGIPDAWDQAASMGLLPAWLDRDGDGSFDWHEFTSGTSPVDPGSVLKLSQVLRPDARLELKFTALPGRFYNVEKNVSLDPASNWTTVRNRISVTASNIQTVLPAPPVEGFYRITVSN
jgi:hypothetical protein